MAKIRPDVTICGCRRHAMVCYIFAMLFIGFFLCWSPVLSAHDAIYPHHREDFESMARRRELQVTVLLITAGFVGILATAIYFAVRKSKMEPDESDEPVRTRLSAAANDAAKAAQQVRNANGTISKAIQAGLTTYAQASGVVWKPHTRVLGNTVRCKIGDDIITLSIQTDSDSDAEFVRLKAERAGQQGSSQVIELKVKRKDGEE